MIQVLGPEGPIGQAADLTGAVAVLSAMITPAVLISACGSLAISTSNRLSRTIERTRRLSEQFTALAGEEVTELTQAKQAMLFDQLERATNRSRLLQRAMTRIYVAVSVFVATSVAIGIVGVTGYHYAWIPISLGLAGAALLFHASVLLIVESRVQLRAIRNEMDFVWSAGRQLAPADLLARQRARRRRIYDWWSAARRQPPP